MLKLLFPSTAAALALAASFATPLAPAAAALGPDAARCRSGSGEPALLVNVSGFKNRVGKLRVQLYGGDPKTFLERGAKLKRIDLPVTRSGAMNVCVAVLCTGTTRPPARPSLPRQARTCVR